MSNAIEPSEPGIRSRPPFRADHVGSLLRPPAVVAARKRRSAGGISEEQLREIEDRAVTELVAMQQQVGLMVATDGEVRRSSYHMDFISRLQGITGAHVDEAAPAGMVLGFKREDGSTIVSSTKGMHVSGKVVLRDTIFADDFTYLQSQVTTATPKLTIPSPMTIYARGGRAAISESAYPDLDEFWTDLVEAYREEVRRLADLGCAYLQIDDTTLAILNDPAQQEIWRARGDDPAQVIQSYVRHQNRVTAARPRSMRITTHMCRGNYRSAWVAEGSYEFVAELVFNELDVDGFFMEFDDERAGGFEPLRFVPKDRIVVLGLVTTKSGKLESKDQLLRRIEQASRFVPIEQLCLSPQCGFASTAEGNDLTFDEQVAKLRLVVETAEEVWGR